MTERPVFGVGGSGEKKRRPRVSKTKVIAEDPIAAYRMDGLFVNAVTASSVAWEKKRQSDKQRRIEVLKKSYGGQVQTNWRFSPSVSAMCVRQEGFTHLGYIPEPERYEDIMAMKLGSSMHYSLLRDLKPFGWDELVVIEADDPPISGRVDFLFPNPVFPDEWQILDFKLMSDYGFRQIKREGLPSHLKKVAGIYNPSPEARNQMLIYMHILRNQGKKVTCATVFCINRSTFERKECPVFWDATAQSQAQEIIEKMRTARQEIESGRLPSPSVDSKSASYVCGKFCRYRKYCDFGQLPAAERVRKAQKLKPPNWALKESKKIAEERKRRMQGAGINQPPLFEL